ncbi:MAG: ribosome biogenesis GTPase Der [Desulfovibrio sp.]|jgi:GTP-binding protein|nr:ribosome biogenesis GTPase Der [Desulfovibrio sp.]
MPKVVLLGRPNVGKSTLFNRLIRSNRAITHDRPGVTRDRLEGVVKRRGENDFLLVDTGGITLDGGPGDGPEDLRGYEAGILEQAKLAMREADLLCLVGNAREGLNPLDGRLADFLRTTGKPILLALNKVDGPDKEDLLSPDFYGLGLPLVCCSSAHGYNIRLLEEEIRARLPGAVSSHAERLEEDAGPDGEAPMRVALIGRPNAGKSSLLNALAGEERMLVSDKAGTTRDSVDVRVCLGGRELIFADTAGIRRRARISDAVERFSVSSAVRSSAGAHVSLLVLDGSEGLTQQDKRLIDLLDTRKAAFIILINKSDLIAPGQIQAAERLYRKDLDFCPHIPLLFVSAQSGLNLRRIVPAAVALREECLRRVGTGVLNRIMAQSLTRRQPPLVRGRRVKFFYLTQAESDPPAFVFFVNDPERVLPPYARYLEKFLREQIGLKHAPLRVHFRPAHADRRAAGRD